jgi:ubiquinone/menaquinone biosynthesis C-methylase UbiE
MRRSARYERMAALYDREILPVWAERFGRMILRGLSLPPHATVLDFGCGAGYPALEVVKRLDTGRVVGIDSCAPMVELARQKAGELLSRQLFLRTEDLGPKLPFADGVFDLVISNLGLMETSDPAAVLVEMARVTRPGGRVIVTFPLRGTFAEFHDIYREVLLRADRTEVLARLDAHVARWPEPDQAMAWMQRADLYSVELEMDAFTLLFKSSREFFYAPVIEYGPLPGWKDLAGKGEEMQAIFLEIKEAIDAYFGGRPFELTVKVGCLRGRRPENRGRKDDDVPRPDEVSRDAYVADEDGG